MMKSPSTTVFSMMILFLLVLRILFKEMVLAQNTKVAVGVVLDFDNWIGKIGFSCINMSLTDFYSNNSYYKTRLVLHTRDSKSDVVGAAAAALGLIKNVKVQAILGPETSMQADFVIKLGEKAQVPIISFSASSPYLTSPRNPFYFQATQNDKTQVNAISAIVQYFQWRQAVPIYVDNEYGLGIIPYLMDALQVVDARVPYQSAISPLASDDQILQELYKLMTMQTRVFIVHMFPSLGSRLFTKAKEIGMMREGYVWIMTDGMTNLLNTLDPSVLDSMHGALGVKPYVPKTKELEYFQVRWKRKFHQDNPDILDAELNVYGLWAYDAAMALAVAIEESGTTNFRFRRAGVSSNIPTDLETLRLSQNGPNLVRALSNTRFKGLTGDFHFINNQLQSSAFQIINLNDGQPRGIGFWTPVKGLVKKLKSSSKASLAPIIWPGDSISVPKGWEIPINGKKLRIGIPIKNGFTKFVNVTRDPITNITQATGFCIDVFDAVMKELPYAVAYDYIPFQDLDKLESYNDLVYQVFLGKFDAVVGDVTIVANRSLYVDFTLPYTESDISMLVRVQNDENNDAGIFLRPFSWKLWVTTLATFLWLAFVIWVLEHRKNSDFRGRKRDQVGTSLYFSFSTMVLSHREQVLNNGARLVVTLWSFVILVITQNYTASLTSLLTVQRLEPTVTYVTELIQNKEMVGYQHGSFVCGVLKGLGFEDKQLMQYNSPEELDKLLSLGTTKQGIAAAFDESPYMKLILARNCSNYTMIEPSKFMLNMPVRTFQQFKTDGFGFVFPKGSPLVADVSRAILKVTEDDIMRRIEDAWFGEDDKCPGHSNSVSSSALGLDSFWVLFAITGGVSVLTVVAYISIFLYKHRVEALDGSQSIGSRIFNLSKIFCEMDPEATSSGNGEMDEGNDANGGGHGAPNEGNDADGGGLGAPNEGNDANGGGHGAPSEGNNANGGGHGALNEGNDANGGGHGAPNVSNNQVQEDPNGP